MKSAKGNALEAVDTAVAGLRCADRALSSTTPHCARCSGAVLTPNLSRRLLGQLLPLACSPSLHRESFGLVRCLQVWLPRVLALVRKRRSCAGLCGQAGRLCSVRTGAAQR